MGFGPRGDREALVGASLQPPLYNSVAAAGTIVSFAPSSGRYPILTLFQCTTDTNANIVELQVLDITSTWRTFLRVRLLGDTGFAMGFPALRLNKVNVGGTEFDVFVGDGTTATLRAVAVGVGNWEVFLWVGEE